MQYQQQDWVWIQPAIAQAIHDEQLAEHGGGSGVRDAGLLESVLARPQQLAHYGEPPPDVYALAAAYGYGLARNHPFIDGNKRTAFVVMLLFLYLNGYRIEATDAEKAMTMLKVAAGQIDEPTLATWLRTHAVPRQAVHEPKAQYKTSTTSTVTKKPNERKV